MNIAEQYIKDVINENVIVGELTRLAVERHLNDLKNKKWEYYFDEEAGERIIKFFRLLRHSKGTIKGDPYHLQPFMAFELYVLFGWKRKDTDARRFRTAYCEVARKNVKSERAAGVALYCLLMDQEGGAEVYTVATKKDQARQVFDYAKIMGKYLRKDSKRIRKLLGIHKYNLHVLDTDSKMEALSSDSNTLDGSNPSCVILDEYHAHKTDELRKVMENGMGARWQPLMWIITTAGFNREGPCFQFRKNCIDILKGIKKDETTFATIYALDEGDDWNDESVWVKANPSIGQTPTWEFMKSEYTKAKNMGGHEEIQFKTKNLNFWTTTSSTWIADDVWQATGSDWNPDHLIGRKCWNGLDLASIRDITALCLLFPPEEEGEKFKAIWRFWLPEETAKNRAANDGVDYLRWAEEGWITLTPGNVLDYAYIKAEFIRLNEKYELQSTAYDRWNSSQLVIELQDEEFEMNPFGQGFASMSAPTKELERLVVAGELDHGNNPVTRWMMSNVTLRLDPAGNIKIDKSKSSEKVDGAVALVEAIGEYMTFGNDGGPSVYEDRGILTV